MIGSRLLGGLKPADYAQAPVAGGLQAAGPLPVVTRRNLSSPVEHERPQRVAGADDDVLEAFELVGDGAIARRSVEPRVPECIAGCRVERNEVADGAAGEQNVA